MEGILSGKKDGLIAEANRRAVSSDGTMADIRQRIVEDMVSKSEPVPARWLPLQSGGLAAQAGAAYTLGAVAKLAKTGFSVQTLSS